MVVENIVILGEILWVGGNFVGGVSVYKTGLVMVEMKFGERS